MFNVQKVEIRTAKIQYTGNPNKDRICLLAGSLFKPSILSGCRGDSPNILLS